MGATDAHHRKHTRLHYAYGPSKRHGIQGHAGTHNTHTHVHIIQWLLKLKAWRNKLRFPNSDPWMGVDMPKSVKLQIEFPLVPQL